MTSGGRSTKSTKSTSTSTSSSSSTGGTSPTATSTSSSSSTSSDRGPASATVADACAAERDEVVQVVGAVLGHAQPVVLGEEEVHLRRRLGLRCELEDHVDAVDPELLVIREVEQTHEHDRDRQIISHLPLNFGRHVGPQLLERLRIGWNCRRLVGRRRPSVGWCR